MPVCKQAETAQQICWGGGGVEETNVAYNICFKTRDGLEMCQWNVYLIKSQNEWNF